METQAALGRAEGEMMLHAVTGEDLRGAVVAMNGQDTAMARFG